MHLLPEQLLAPICQQMRTQANTDTWNGIQWTPYFWACRYQISTIGISLIFTRDEGHHLGGWFKNPDYERCYHLSISFRDGFHTNVAVQIVKTLFGPDYKRVRIASPYTAEGKQAEVYYYRLFCNQAWQGINPRGEVYSTVHTPLDYKSFSEIHTGL